MKKQHTSLFIGLVFMALSACNEAPKEKTIEKDNSAEVEEFLANYNIKFQELYYASSEAQWTLNTHIVEGDTITSKIAEEADAAYAAFIGSEENIEKSRSFLKSKEGLSDIQIKQLEVILYNAGNNPAIAGDLVKERIAAETKQTELLFGFETTIDGKPASGNDINAILKDSKNLNDRLKAWEASKEVGKTLKSGLNNLKTLRNKTVQALGYEDYFDYQVSAYGMNKQEMMQVCGDMIHEMWPLYRELHTWARYTLAKKYKEEVPEMLPAHWLTNKWGQEWSSMVQLEGIDLDAKLSEKGANWIVEEGERFYMSLGFDKLPPVFYEKSSLYPAPEGADYKKNSHASAWHMNLNQDVRSLMSVVPNTEWWGTTLHELGHIYYFLEYSNPKVPMVLREGANRAYHEAMGSLIGLAAMQQPFLEGRGLLEPGLETDKTQALLSEALDFVVLIPWGAGVMTEFEHDLYAKDLPVDEFNKRWWELKKKYQGIVPPTERGEEYCDAASKTHINNDAAQYYDYAMSNILLFQFHDHIANKILKQDPHATNYYGNKEVGKFIKSLMVEGATVDWREDLQNKLGEPMSARAMAAYFAPLMEYLKEQNKGRKHTLPEHM
ncbi:MAG: peptidase [Bacteroidetes bacterium]|nr:MAG: peptidase [Bacteroidota bacterium]MBL1143483.1 peptidase [Bacteroidota bacterium]NOG56286.1 M2 family metallopeptidase [Bacteroidota bacterium]